MLEMKNKSRPSVEYQARVIQFNYDPAQALDVREAGVEFRDGVAIHDVSFASVAAGRVAAFLVVPPGEGTFPGVIFVHPAPGNRYTFLDEAAELAQYGAVSLLIDAPWSQAEAWGRTMGQPEHDLEEHLKTAKDLRRAVDVLTARAEVEAERMAYVGHSLGALFGGILAGVEDRIKTCVLMAGVGSFTDVAVLNIPQLRGPALDHYRQVLEPIDPLYYIQFAAPAPLLFQFGLQDRSFACAKFIGFATAGSEPKVVKWYHAGHDLPDPGARRDRLDWLRAHLSLDERNEPQPGVLDTSATPRRG
jgi:dienelactone hydrolase